MSTSRPRPKRLAVAWDSYRRVVIPQGASECQLTECRRAFYAGAQALADAFLTGVDPTTDDTLADLEMMEDLEAELKEFQHELVGGRV